MNYKNTNVLIIGMAKSGQSAMEFLQKHKANVFIYDSNIDTLSQLKSILKNVTILTKIDEQSLQNIDLIVLSPAVSIFCEEVKLAQLFGIKIISELQLGLDNAKGDKILLTGTNGKTTTVNLIEQAFNYAKRKNLLVGNVGNPITRYVSKYRTNYIVEVSSFQLESSLVQPNIACILNITQNHLNRHFSYANYIQTKYKIFCNQTKRDFLVLNYDDELLRKLQSKQTEIFGELVDIKSKIFWFSAKTDVLGSYLKDGKIYFNNGKKTTFIEYEKNIKLLGKHNAYNVLAMVTICMLKHLPLKAIRLAIKNFAGVEHRLQLVASKNGVDYINDSKSTTPFSTITALNAIKKPVVLILGGSDKGLDYDDFVSQISCKIKYAVLTGEIAEKLEKSFQKNNVKNYCVVKQFDRAVQKAKSLSSNGDCVLLSPATASFDCFNNFEHRGEVYIDLVKKL